MSSRSFHLEKSLSATTATTKHCTVLNTHCVTVTSILFGYSSSNADCKDIYIIYIYTKSPCDVGEDHEQRALDPRHPARSRPAGGDSEGSVVVDGAQRRSSVERKDQDTGEAERDAGDLGHADGGPQPDGLHPQQQRQAEGDDGQGVARRRRQGRRCQLDAYIVSVHAKRIPDCWSYIESRSIIIIIIMLYAADL
ncbi:hypothetical protein PVAP13_7NG067278 [Panicum virgatum]|uniref:Uncharacterized protein n=1 Tax=Panicum virgatum TaxID=38727 RepID=A0A8T0PTM6_PANVG|nr:hypothetical protein PVAP13_7NG067278 [Panicum virgatum]